VKHVVQNQLRRLMFVLTLLTLIEAAFFWRMLTQQQNDYLKVDRTQKIVAIAGELSRSFLEDSLSHQRALTEVRKKIRSDLKNIRSLVQDKESEKLLLQLQKEWQFGHSQNSTSQLMILIRSLIAKQQSALGPLEISQRDGVSMTKNFMYAYTAIFILAIFALSQYAKNHIFQPLHRLYEKIKNFEAGNLELPPMNESKDEIGALEGQFYSMADRVGSTVAQLKELDKVKTDFISIASHELRTPMTSVKGSLSLVLSGSLSDITPDVREILIIAEKETDRLIRLINDILDLTKMEAKKLSLNKQWSLMQEVAESATQGLAGLYQLSKVNIQIEAYALPIKALMDKDRIQQVIINLLSNAVKFSPQGSTVILKFEPHNGGIVVSVKDSGPGIRQESQTHMFEKFASHESGKSKIIKGTGLGLPICKAIVEQHGGQIGLTSEFGLGSTFYFYLPEAKVLDTMETKAA
jgi:signal transduction histidine kinase